MELRKLYQAKDLLKGEARRYNANSDAGMRLGRTLIRYEDKLYYVKDVVGPCDLICWDLESSEDVLLNANDSKLDISSIPLGYLNNQNISAFYPMRRPTRSQRQGVDTGRLMYFSPFHRQTIGMGGIDLWPAFRKLHENSYPTVEECLKAKSSLAFSRSWCLVATKSENVKTLFCKDIPVGTYLVRPRTFLFAPGQLNNVRERSLQNVLVKKGEHHDYQIRTSSASS